MKDNEIVKDGVLSEKDKNIGAGEEKVVELKDFPEIQAVEGSDYILEFSAVLTKDQTWSGDFGGKTGDEIAFEQLMLSYETTENSSVIDVENSNEIEMTENDKTAIITGSEKDGDKFSVTIDKTTGYITEYKVNGNVLVKEGPKPNYWRARISNDPNFTDGMKNAATNFKVRM